MRPNPRDRAISELGGPGHADPLPPNLQQHQCQSASMSRALLCCRQEKQTHQALTTHLLPTHVNARLSCSEPGAEPFQTERAPLEPGLYLLGSSGGRRHSIFNTCRCQFSLCHHAQMPKLCNQVLPMSMTPSGQESTCLLREEAALPTALYCSCGAHTYSELLPPSTLEVALD